MLSQKYPIISAIIICLIFSTLTCSADPALRLWYQFQDTSGTIITDSSGNNFDGTLNGSMYFSTPGPIGNCLSNNRAWSGSYIEVPASVFDTADQQLTIAFWANRTEMCETYGTGSFIKASASGTGKLGAGDYKDGTSHYATYAGGDGTTKWWWSYGTNAPDDTWHHLAYVFDFTAGTEKLYFNGLLVTNQASDSGDSFTGIDACRIFTRTSTGTNNWWDSYHGKLDEFRIYDKALNDDEIWFLANPADLNGDKLINLDDVKILAYDWLDNSSGDSDIDKDGIVNFKDYAFLLNKWNNGGQYYFDSIDGDDNNLGTSPDQPWQTLSKFNSKIFTPGDRIYFKASSQWDGNITPKGSGTPQAPIIVDAYGDISNENNKPRFDGNGTVAVTLQVSNIEYWEFNNLQVTNLGTEPGDWRRAVGVGASGVGQINHLHFKNMYVHSVNGTDTFGGGAAFELGASDPASLPRVSCVNDLLIEDCHIKSIDNCGIHGGCGSATPGDAHGTNHVIRGNYFEDMGGAAVVVIGTDGCIVENNEVNGCMKRYGSCAMWPWGAYNTIFQYNEVYGCDDRGDGEPYDADYHCTGTIFQYNYSHDNPGGFMRICSDDGSDPVGNVGTIVRYNISVNDGDSDDAIFPTWKRCDDVQIYNNIIYSPPGKTVNLVDTSASGGDGAIWHWSNNIFFSNGTLRYEITDGSTNYWSNNCFYGSHEVPRYLFGYIIGWQSGTPDDSNKITSNPNFVDPSSAGLGIDTLDGFKLQSNSPCINTGTPITNNGSYDFWGNILYNGNPDIGAHEK